MELERREWFDAAQHALQVLIDRDEPLAAVVVVDRIRLGHRVRSVLRADGPPGGQSSFLR